MDRASGPLDDRTTTSARLTIRPAKADGRFHKITVRLKRPAERAGAVRYLAAPAADAVRRRRPLRPSRVPKACSDAGAWSLSRFREASAACRPRPPPGRQPRAGRARRGRSAAQHGDGRRLGQGAGSGGDAHDRCRSRLQGSNARARTFFAQLANAPGTAGTRRLRVLIRTRDAALGSTDRHFYSRIDPLERARCWLHEDRSRESLPQFAIRRTERLCRVAPSLASASPLACRATVTPLNVR